MSKEKHDDKKLIHILTDKDLIDIFNEIDTDHSNYITTSELKLYLKKLKLPSDEKTISQIEKLILSTNTSYGQIRKKGAITRGEFSLYVKSHLKMLNEFFEAYDKNGDGLISRSELINILQDFGIKEDYVQQTCTLLIQEIEKNKSAKEVTMHSFFKHFALMPSRMDMEKCFSHYTSCHFAENGFDSEVKEINQTDTPVWITFVSATCCGVASRTATAPMDRLKLIRQTQSKKNITVFETFMKMIKHEGVFGLFRGNGANCVKVIPERSFTFLTYDKIRNVICEDPKNPQFGERLLCGGIAGCTSQTLIYPMEVVKTRLAISRKGLYTGIWDVFKKVRYYEGTLALYKGLAPSLIGITPYCAIDLALFNTLKCYYIDHYDTIPGAITLLGCGICSGLVAQTAAYPLALIRTRLQMQGTPGTHTNYRGFLDCFTTIVKNDGFSGLYKGLVPNYMKAIPAGGISFVVFEKVKYFLKNSALD